MKADYTVMVSLAMVGLDGDNRQMKADYTKTIGICSSGLDGDDRQMKADYIRNHKHPAMCRTEITAK